MTVPASAQKAGPFNCNGVVDDFDFEFKVFATSDVRVVRTTAAGVESTLTLITDYTVSLNGDQDADPGGSITTTSVYADGKITLVSNLSETQPTVLTNAGGFYPKVVERSLDRLAILIKQMREKLDRAVTVDVSSGVDPADLLDSIDDSVAAAAASEAAAAASETAAGLSETAAAASEAAAEASAAVAAAAGVIALTSVAGTNTITASAAGVTSYDTGRPFTFAPANTNGGATTLNVNALGAKNVYVNGAACVGGELVAGVPYVVVYDGTRFGVTGPYALLDGAVTTAKIDDEAVTVAKLDAGARAVTRPLNANPNMLIDQINEGGLYTAGGGVQMMDEWSGTVAGTSGVFKTRRLAAPWNAGESCMEITCTTADASVAAGDLAIAYTSVEGYDAAILNAGLADAQSLTVQFRFQTSKVGTYCIGIQNSAQNRSYVGTITVADTAVHDYAVTLTMDTSGTWLKTNGVGLYMFFALMAGSTYQTTAGAWAAGNFVATSAQVNFLDNVANIAYLGKCHIIKGAIALPFAPASYEEDLRKCQRYYEKTFNQGTAVVQACGSYSGALLSIVPAGDSLVYFNFIYKSEKRTAPTIVTYNPTQANNYARNWGNSADSTGVSVNGNVGTSGIQFYAGSGASQNPYGIHATANARLT